MLMFYQLKENLNLKLSDMRPTVHMPSKFSLPKIMYHFYIVKMQ